MPMSIEDSVRNNVVSLLAMLKPGISEDSDDFRFVREKLTRMAILGTLPPGCSSRNTPPGLDHEM